MCVRQATGSKIGTVLQAAATIIAALVIAFIYGWKLALVILAFLPIMVLSGKVQGKVIAGSAQSEKSHIQEAGKVRKLLRPRHCSQFSLFFFRAL